MQFAFRGTFTLNYYILYIRTSKSNPYVVGEINPNSVLKTYPQVLHA